MIPAELEPLVYAPSGLDDLPHESAFRTKPGFTAGDGAHATTPGDLAVIYNITPLYQKGINGAGQKIVVAGESAFNVQDIRDFRDSAGLPASDPKVILTPGSKDPGYSDSIGEAVLDGNTRGPLRQTLQSCTCTAPMYFSRRNTPSTRISLR